MLYRTKLDIYVCLNYRFKGSCRPKRCEFDLLANDVGSCQINGKVNAKNPTDWFREKKIKSIATMVVTPVEQRFY